MSRRRSASGSKSGSDSGAGDGLVARPLPYPPSDEVKDLMKPLVEGGMSEVEARFKAETVVMIEENRETFARLAREMKEDEERAEAVLREAANELEAKAEGVLREVLTRYGEFGNRTKEVGRRGVYGFDDSSLLGIGDLIENAKTPKVGELSSPPSRTPLPKRRFFFIEGKFLERYLENMLALKNDKIGSEGEESQ